MRIKPIKKIEGIIKIPGDKSISHRSVMFGSIARGKTLIDNFLTGEDCISTINCFRKLGIKIDIKDNRVQVLGKGLHGLTTPDSPLYVGNSGTTIRLMSGLLAAQDFSCEISGDESIQKRPMGRVLAPLQEMGAHIYGIRQENLAPIAIEGRRLNAITYDMPVASAQVKSAILLASLYARGTTVIREKLPTRDHTEKLLNYLGADIKSENGIITSTAVDELFAADIRVPSDISSAAFFIVAALILPGSHIMLKNIGVNPTRTGIVDALRQMGGKINYLNERVVSGEPVADIEVMSSNLKAVTISGEIIPRMIDEIPIFAVAACFAEGTTVIKDAEELKVKESNRIKTMTDSLQKMSANVSETDDGMIITGTGRLIGCEADSFGDHRVAMSMAVAGLAAEAGTETVILNPACVDISFPGFFEQLV